MLIIALLSSKLLSISMLSSAFDELELSSELGGREYQNTASPPALSAQTKVTQAGRAVTSGDPETENLTLLRILF